MRTGSIMGNGEWAVRYLVQAGLGVAGCRMRGGWVGCWGNIVCP